MHESFAHSHVVAPNPLKVNAQAAGLARISPSVTQLPQSPTVRMPEKMLNVNSPLSNDLGSL